MAEPSPTDESIRAARDHARNAASWLFSALYGDRERGLDRARDRLRAALALLEAEPAAAPGPVA